MDSSTGVLYYFEPLSNSETKKFMAKKDPVQFENWKKDNDVSDIYTDTKNASE